MGTVCIDVPLKDYALAQALGTLEHRAPRVRSGMYRVDVQRRTGSTGHTVLIEMAVLLRHVEDMTTRYPTTGLLLARCAAVLSKQ
jgi:hypothetical protein